MPFNALQSRWQTVMTSRCARHEDCVEHVPEELKRILPGQTPVPFQRNQNLRVVVEQCQISGVSELLPVVFQRFDRSLVLAEPAVALLGVRARHGGQVRQASGPPVREDSQQEVLVSGLHPVDQREDAEQRGNQPLSLDGRRSSGAFGTELGVLTQERLRPQYHRSLDHSKSWHPAGSCRTVPVP